MKGSHKFVGIAVLALVLAMMTPGRADAYSFGEYDFAYEVGGTQSVQNPVLTDPSRYGSGGFNPSGDVFHVMDAYPDGQSIGVQWRLTNGTRSGVCINNLGAVHNGVCNKNFVEGLGIQIRVGRCDLSAQDCLNNLTVWNSWSAWRNATT